MDWSNRFTFGGVEKLNESNLNNSGISLRVQTQLITLCKVRFGLEPLWDLSRSIQLLHLDQARFLGIGGWSFKWFG